MLVCPETSEENATKFALNLRKNIENYHFEKVGQITMSIGVSQMKEGVDLDTLINNADNAMYFAKENGRNRVVTFSKIS